MKPSTTIVLLILVAAIAIGATVMFLNSTRPTVVPTPATEPANVAALNEELAQATAERDALQTELEAARANAAAEPRSDAALFAETPEPAGDQPAPAEPANESESEEKPNLEEIREEFRDSPQAMAQFKALTELLYADLLNALELDAETKAALRQYMVDSQTEEIALAQYAMQQGDIPWKQVMEWRDEERARLAELAKPLLSPEQQAAWDDYASTIDDRAMEAQLGNQIRAFSSGLTDENYETTMQVAVEEFRAEQMLLEQSDQPFTLEENIYYQIRAMDNMRERLQPALPPDQFAELENWLTMGENTLTASLPDNDNTPN